MAARSVRVWLAVGAVVLLGLLTYLPAFNNPFLADDYAFLLHSERLSEDWGALSDFPLGWRRLAAHLCFYLSFSLFGLHPAPYYGTNLLLHLVNAGLVFLLVSELLQDRRAGFVAALFFVAYERPQETIFWISARHELLLSLGVVATAFFFARYRRTGDRRFYAAALAGFAVSAVTKESFLILLPLLVLLDFALPGRRVRPGWRAHLPFWILAGAYVLAMFVGPLRYSFAGTGSGVSLHFFEVYLRSLHRLFLFVWVFLLLAWLVYRFAPGAGRFSAVLREKAFWFFLGWLLISIVPYSFVLYADYLSSRHAYLPAVGLAGVAGLLLVRGWTRTAAKKIRLAGVAVLGLILGANVAHVWRKDDDYLARAAPTEHLVVALRVVSLLDHQAGMSPANRAVILCDFPYPQIVARGAARFFTPVDPGDVLVRDCATGAAAPPGALVLQWNAEKKFFE